MAKNVKIAGHRRGRSLRKSGRALRIALAAAVFAAAVGCHPVSVHADDASVVSSLRDALYVPAGGSLNTLAPAGSFGGLGSTYTALDADAAAVYGTDPLPAAFDLRNVDGVSRVTPVRNQNPWNTCWAFGAIGAMESNLAMQGAGFADAGASDSIDLSELFVSGFGRMEVPAETMDLLGAPSQVGEGITPARDMGVFETGGHVLDAVAWIMAMGGVPDEHETPYRSDSGTVYKWEDPLWGKQSCFSPYEPWTLTEETRADLANRVAGIESAGVLPGPYNNRYDAYGNLVLGEYDPAVTDAVKRAIMDNGAVAASYRADGLSSGEGAQEMKYFSKKNWCQYVYEPLGTNHVVTVVGWDDDYPRENFPTAPAGDGAWIVKNSWGSNAGEPGVYSEWGLDGSGYFYLSYYDKSLFSFDTIVAEADPASDRVVQQYDLLGAPDLYIDAPLSTEDTSIANVFTAEEDMCIESVTAHAGVAGMTADVEIYLLGERAAAPDDGALVAEATEELPLAGYYTIDLDEPVPVQEGQRYAVVQTLSGSVKDGSGGEIPVWGTPVERGISRDLVHEIGYLLYADTVVNEGESYLELGGEWADASALNDDPILTENGAVTFGNVEIKVYGSPTDLGEGGSFSVLHTNDTHGRYSVKGSAGDAVNAFGAVAALADDTGADLILDAGDTFHGTTFATESKGGAIAQLMDAAGYDATTPGNHDWSYGSERLDQIDADADFSVLAANVEDTQTGEPLFESPYLLREVALADAEGNLTGRSVTVGVLGVIDEDFYGSTAPDNVAGVAFADSVVVATETAAEMRAAGAEVVVALTHNEDPQAFAASVEGVDAVVAGHEHVAIDETVKAADGRDVAVVEVASSPTAEYFSSIGVLTLELENHADGSVRVAASSSEGYAVARHTSKTVPTEQAARPNEAIDSLTANLVAQSDAALAQVVGHSGRSYDYADSTPTTPGGWELVRTEDTPIGHVVTGAYLAQAGADLAFENAGGIRGGIPAGDVTAADILSVSPYGNTLATYSMTGARVLDTIERSLALSAECRDVLAKQVAAAQTGEDPMQHEWPRSSGSVLAVGGATMTVDWGRPDGERVTSIEVGDKPLDPDRTYTVALNSYLPAATDVYPSFADAKLVHEYGTCEEALRALIAQDGWEQTMARISGSVTYASGNGAGSDQPAARPVPTAPQSSSGGRLAATGDSVALVGVAAIFGAAALAFGVCARRR